MYGKRKLRTYKRAKSTGIGQTPVRPSAHVTGDIGQTAVALELKRWGWTADTVISDYGEDLDCTIFVDHRRTSLHFRCQIKSTADPEAVRRLKSGNFAVSISTSLCRSWLLSYFAVLLIIYDDAAGEIYWADAIEQVRNQLEKLSQKTMTMHVSCVNLLRKNQSQITDTVQRFYSQLMRLSSQALTCKVFPVIMPGYRAIPMDHFFRADVPKQLPDDVRVNFTRKDKNWLPAWTTEIKSLDLHFIPGWSITSSGRDIQEFSTLLRTILLDLQLPTEDSEWVSFICGPVEFQASGDTHTENSIWNRELTTWRNYTRFGANLVSDHDYAFEPPAEFLRQGARRAQSWETFHHVDPVRDVSIQLFVEVPATPGDHSDISAIQTNIEGQFIPWICSSRDLDELNKLLWPLELGFRKVENISSPEGYETGVICTHFFAPHVGLFSPAHSWKEFVDGTVKAKLESNGLLSKLPGYTGPSEVSELILGMFGNLMDDVPSSILTSERNHTSGLPLDHRERRVLVQRFREVTSLNRGLAGRTLAKCKTDVRRLLGLPHFVECSFDLFEAFPYKQIAELSLVWQPLFHESSAQSFERLGPTVFRAFDKILPRKRRVKSANTYDVLRLAGSLYFEEKEE